MTIDPDGWPEPDRWSIWAARGDVALELVAEDGRVIAAVPHLAYLIGHPTRLAHECLLIEGYEVRKEPYRQPLLMEKVRAEALSATLM